MTDKNVYDEQDHMTRLKLWGLGEMIRGASYAALVFVGILLFVYAIWLVGETLPEESKQAPSPYGAIETVQTSLVV